MRNGESKLQEACVKVFRMEHYNLKKRLWAIPNGGQRSITTATRLKAEGVMAGVYDLFLSIPHNGKGGLFIEMKYGKGKLTDNQKEFKEEHKDDYEFAEAWTLEGFRFAIKNYLRGYKKLN